MQLYVPSGEDVGRLLCLAGYDAADIGPYRLLFYLSTNNLTITTYDKTPYFHNPNYRYLDVYNLTEVTPCPPPDFWTDIYDSERARFLYLGEEVFQQLNTDMLYYFLYQIWFKLLSKSDQSIVQQIIERSALLV